MAKQLCEDEHEQSFFFSDSRVSLAHLALSGLTLTVAHTTAIAASTSPPRPDSTPRCQGLSLSESGATPKELKPLYEAVADFEKAFADNNNRLFRTLMHPALSRERQNPEVFDSTVQEFGLEKAKLQRNALYSLDLPLGSEKTTAECGKGEIRGVVGPTQQYAVVHTFTGGNEQIRVFTLFAQVPPQLMPKQGNDKRPIGIVYLQAQVWTHGKRSPEALLVESRKWSILGEPIAAWIHAAAAERILLSNSYFVPTDALAAQQLSRDSKARIPSLDTLRSRVKSGGTGWDFIDLAVIFQAKSLEIGAKFRMKGEEPLNAQIEKCKTLGLTLAQEFPGLVKQFTGVECMPYGPSEKTEEAPDAGTQFHTWKELASRTN